MQELNKLLSEKDEVIRLNCCEIQDLKNELNMKNKQCKDFLQQLKSAAKKTNEQIYCGEQDKMTVNDDAAAAVSCQIRKLTNINNNFKISY